MSYEKTFKRAFSLLKRWCDAMLAHRIDMPGIKSAHGGLFCPSCSYVHGRIADAVYPFVYMYKSTGDISYIECAKGLLDWCDENVLVKGGMYNNDKNKTMWVCTTSFCQVSLGNTLLKLGDCLDEDFRQRILDTFEKQTKEIFVYFNKPAFKTSINYSMQFCYCMALAYRILGDEKYKEEAYKKYEYLDRKCFTGGGLIVGEGNTLEATENGSYCIDMGYNLEESMCALAGFAEIFGDKDIISSLSERMKVHLEYMLPDGAIDNSWGSRSFKWTYYGSRTSDGCQGGLVALARLTGDKVFEKAAIRNFELYERCTTKDGLLAGGLMYEDAGEEPCMHHTFCHAKALTELCEYLEENTVSVDDAVLPREKEYGTKFIQGANTALVSCGKWRATISANDYRGYKYANGGGSMTLLWHEDVGAILAANMSRYIPIEPKNMQFQKNAVAEICMTPRIMCYDNADHDIVSGDGIYSSDNGINTQVTLNDDNSVTVKNKLCDVNGKILSDGDYSITYFFDKEDNSISVKLITAVSGVYSLPVIAAHNDTVTSNGKSADVKRNGKIIEIVANNEIYIRHRDIGKTDKYVFERIYRGENENTRVFSTVGGFMYVPFEITLDKNKENIIRITIK